MKKIIVCLVGILSLVACTTKYASNDKQQYLKSRNSPSLEVPAPLTNTNISDFYDLPTPQGDTKVNILPPA